MKGSILGFCSPKDTESPGKIRNTVFSTLTYNITKMGIFIPNVSVRQSQKSVEFPASILHDWPDDKALLILKVC